MKNFYFTYFEALTTRDMYLGKIVVGHYEINEVKKALCK